MSMRPDDHRRKWDRAEYERLAQERLRSKKTPKGHEADDDDDETKVDLDVFTESAKRELLKRRDYKVDLEGKLGKSVVISKSTPSSQSGGYYCNVCDCVVKDSINFLDHINGKKHQRNLGMSMKVERSSLDQVKERFKVNKKKMEEKQKDYELESRLREAKEEEEKLKEHKRERRKERKRKAEESVDDLDDDPATSDMAAIMGFAGFGGSKKNH
ncbi:zinc finger matrin-type protein 2 isoform X1 [Phlebotomus papatasi]|uniref:zinc finger matrin-type protein 2 isoform X1 n=1 Tax=Phlebotomus papatasi TaxID=29031 RepID=UPI002484175E|nr:zinc finger matrin-type protein 2 isoform X1 [Phlebotomus papatasi]